jgi:hypothetical protein
MEHLRHPQVEGLDVRPSSVRSFATCQNKMKEITLKLIRFRSLFLPTMSSKNGFLRLSTMARVPIRQASALGTLLLAALFAPGANAGVIYSVTGSPDVGYFVGSSGADQVLASSWSQTGSFTNVSISAELGDSSNYGNSGGDAISVYLTNQIGPGTTVANVIATTSISPASVDETDVLFSGLTLGAGNYYLVLGAPGQFAEWYGTNSPAVATGIGVSGNGNSFADKPSNPPNDAFPPASSFDSNPLDNNENLLITVTGDAGLGSPAPEPSSGILLSTALLALTAAKRKRVA